MTVERLMGGRGTSAATMDAIGDWLDTRPVARAATRPEDGDAWTRGAAIFHDPAVGCASCHAMRHRVAPRSRG